MHPCSMTKKQHKRQKASAGTGKKFQYVNTLLATDRPRILKNSRPTASIRKVDPTENTGLRWVIKLGRLATLGGPILGDVTSCYVGFQDQGSRLPVIFTTIIKFKQIEF